MRNKEITIGVLGVGSGGNALLELLAEQALPHTQYISINSDHSALMQSKVEEKIQIGINTTKGLGAGSKADVGYAAAVENSNQIREAIKNCDAVLVLAGLGRGTGTGATQAIARIAKEDGTFVAAAVTTPFAFEGKSRMLQAENGVRELHSIVDSLTILPNEVFPSLIEANLSIEKLFSLSNAVAFYAIQGQLQLLHKTVRRKRQACRLFEKLRRIFKKERCDLCE